jgi:hypothetical protein
MCRTTRTLSSIPEHYMCSQRTNRSLGSKGREDYSSSPFLFRVFIPSGVSMLEGVWAAGTLSKNRCLSGTTGEILMTRPSSETSRSSFKIFSRICLITPTGPSVSKINLLCEGGVSVYHSMNVLQIFSEVVIPRGASNKLVADCISDKRVKEFKTA